MREYFGNSLGIVISRQDPENRGRLKIYFPHIMPVLNANLLKLFGVQGEEVISFNAVGGNLTNGIPEAARSYLENILPFAEPASPIIGNSSSGVLNSVGSYIQRAIGGGSVDKNAVSAGNAGVIAQPKQNIVSSDNPLNGKLDKNNPSQLVPIGGGNFLNPYVAEKWKALKSAAESAAVKIGITNSYRTYAQQIDVKARKGNLAATPGRSNHGLGKALDLTFNGLSDYQWMLQNAPSYEFSQIHPNLQYESAEYWHWQIPSAPMGSGAASTPTTPIVNNNVLPAAPPPSLTLGDTSMAPTPPITDDSTGTIAQNPPAPATATATPPVMSTTPFGRITVYGYAGDSTPDWNSSHAIGAFGNNTLKAGTSFAVSPDIEAQFRANGILPKSAVQLVLSDGTNVTGTWDDRTATSYKGQALTGRFDFYSPAGANTLPFNNKQVMGFGKGDGSIITNAAQSLTTTDKSPAPFDTTDVAKGVFCIPEVGALLWCFFREGNPLFPVYFAASYRSGEWSSAYKSGSPGYGNDPSLQGDDSINRSLMLPNKGGGLIATEGQDTHEVSLVSYSGSHLKFSQDHSMLYSRDDFHAQTDGNKFDITLSNRETHTKGIDNTVINGDCYIKVGNVTDSSVHDAINQIESLIGDVNNEMLKS